MQIHRLKISKQWFEEIVAENKTFEVRLNDRNYHQDDYVCFCEYENNDYTGFCIFAKIKYVLEQFKDGLKTGYVVFSFRVLNYKEEHLLIKENSLDKEFFKGIHKSDALLYERMIFTGVAKEIRL